MARVTEKSDLGLASPKTANGRESGQLRRLQPLMFLSLVAMLLTNVSAEADVFTLRSAYWELTSKRSASLDLFNHGDDPLPVRGSLRFDGGEVSIDVVAPARGTIQINLADISPAITSASDRRSGSVFLWYEADSPVLVGNINLVSFKTEAAANSVLTPAVRPTSGLLRTAWWRPRGLKRADLALLNSSSSTIEFLVVLDGIVSEVMTMSPDESRLVALKTIFPNLPKSKIELPTRGSLELRPLDPGAPLPLVAALVLEDTGMDYFAVFSLADARQLGSANQYAPLPLLAPVPEVSEELSFSAHLVVSNFSPESIKILPTAFYSDLVGAVRAVSLAESSVGPHETLELVCDRSLGGTVLPDSVAPGSILLSLGTVGPASAVGYGLLLVDLNARKYLQAQVAPAPNGVLAIPSAFDVSVGSEAFVSLSSCGSSGGSGILKLNYASGTYSYRLDGIEYGGFDLINIGRLRDDRIPDLNGNVLPADLSLASASFESDSLSGSLCGSGSIIYNRIVSGGKGFVISPIGIQPIVVGPQPITCLEAERDGDPTADKTSISVATVCDGSEFCVEDALPAEPATGTTRLVIRGGYLTGVDAVTVWAPGTDIAPATYLPSTVTGNQVVVDNVHLRLPGSIPTAPARTAPVSYSIKLEKPEDWCEGAKTLTGYLVEAPFISRINPNATQPGMTFEVRGAHFWNRDPVTNQPRPNVVARVFNQNGVSFSSSFTVIATSDPGGGAEQIISVRSLNSVPYDQYAFVIETRLDGTNTMAGRSGAATLPVQGPPPILETLSTVFLWPGQNCNPRPLGGGEICSYPPLHLYGSFRGKSPGGIPTSVIFRLNDSESAAEYHVDVSDSAFAPDHMVVTVPTSISQGGVYRITVMNPDGTRSGGGSCQWTPPATAPLRLSTALLSTECIQTAYIAESNLQPQLEVVNPFDYLLTETSGTFSASVLDGNLGPWTNGAMRPGPACTLGGATVETFIARKGAVQGNGGKRNPWSTESYYVDPASGQLRLVAELCYDVSTGALKKCDMPQATGAGFRTFVDEGGARVGGIWMPRPMGPISLKSPTPYIEPPERIDWVGELGGDAPFCESTQVLLTQLPSIRVRTVGPIVLRGWLSDRRNNGATPFRDVETVFAEAEWGCHDADGNVDFNHCKNVERYFYGRYQNESVGGMWWEWINRDSGADRVVGTAMNRYLVGPIPEFPVCHICPEPGN